MKKIFIATFLAAATASTLPAADPPTINWLADTSTDFFNPSLFEDPANWEGGVVATNDVHARFYNDLSN